MMIFPAIELRLWRIWKKIYGWLPKGDYDLIMMVQYIKLWSIQLPKGDCIHLNLVVYD
jgi:hypothetical protein